MAFLQHLFLSIVALLVSLPATAADPFLLTKSTNRNSESELLLGELEKVIGERRRAVVEERIVRLTLALHPTFQALPHTSEGYVQQAAVRYMLHRYFVDRHGWYVRGLDTNGDAWNSSTPSEILGEHVGLEVRDIFEERLRTRGLSLHEVAVFAAILEGLVHTETFDRLSAAYRLAGLNETAEKGASEKDVLHAMDVYMLMYVLGLDHKKATPKKISVQMLGISQVYPTWSVMQKWAREVRGEVLRFSPLPANSFALTAHVLEEIGSRYGRWQNQECLHIKDMLLKLEEPGTGRVLLSSFYGASLKGAWQLSESRPYLRQMGALDERDVLRPSVVIPNYVNAPSNCVASSAFYSVCCISECEAVLGHLEHMLAAPHAMPSQIAEVVAAFASPTVKAPRQLPAALRQRLEDIAAQHGGHVPLHGRLFMQWLHHAYPNECSFPHLSGSSKPVTMEKWIQETGQDPTASEEAMKQHITESRNATKGQHVRDLPWITEEELFVSWSKPEVAMAFEDVAAGMLMVATVVACSMAVTLARAVTRARAAVSTKPHAKASV